MEWISFAFSVLALVGSATALWFTWTFQPRSNLVTYWDDSRVNRFVDDRVPIVDLTITNNGHAAARDVRIYVDSAGRVDRDHWDGWLSIEPSKQVTVGIPMIKVRREADGTLTRLSPREQGILRPVVTLAWQRDWGRGVRRRKFHVEMS